MASPPQKKTGCVTGCLIIIAIGFFAIVFLNIAGNVFSSLHWKNARGGILSSVEQSVDAGDYERALSIAGPHQSRNDSELNALVEKARNLKRDAEERARQEELAGLIAEIKTSQGAEREAKLMRLLSLEPNTNEFSDELPAIQEKIKQREREAQAKREAEQQAELERKEQAQREQARLAMEAKLAEFKWRYQVSEDQLTSKPTHIAWVKSINEVNFDFPYRGAQRGELMLRTHPQYGKDLILQVEKGQMLVRSYEDTTVKVVFDSGSPVTYKVVGPADHGTTSLFFRNYHGFVEKMLKSKIVKISVPFYQQGDVVFEFNVSDFDSNRYLGKN